MSAQRQLNMEGGGLERKLLISNLQIAGLGILIACLLSLSTFWFRGYLARQAQVEAPSVQGTLELAKSVTASLSELCVWVA